jgi:hypothetical protein
MEMIQLKKIWHSPLDALSLEHELQKLWLTSMTSHNVNSGSDITLISQKTVDALGTKLKTCAGQCIKLIQVTGNTIISGYVCHDLIFNTPNGPVKINVKAYVVKGMSTPYILGSDLANQYSISVLWNEGLSSVLFGSSGQQVPVNNSTSSPSLDKDGHAFRIHVQSDLTNRTT